ncbi:hypothetical protein CVT24_011000 [Panaeolus cyanescens]|uniref:ribonuclease H n=1 Tax=Panaeolus cyanescens TaxID=181874 RepID=A0A409YV57_9AGAR|nr:hypothetical protein CVT24_011000 [Panaeolus cyanescens]
MNQRGGGTDWSHEHNSRFEVSKSVVMHMTRGRERAGWNEETGEGIPVLEVGDEVVKRVRSFKYLGVYVDDELRWKVQESKACEKATKWTLQFKRLAKPSTGINMRLMKQLFNATVIPKLAYALDVWYTPPTKPTEGKKNTGSVAALKKLTTIQRIATLTITGAPRTTPTEVLDAHAGVLPMELLLLKICHRNLVRMATLPETHPLHSLIANEMERPPRNHQSQITKLARIFDLDPRKVEKTGTLPFKVTGATATISVTIRNTAKKAMREERRDEAEVNVYTDGGGRERRVAAAVAYNNGEEEECYTWSHVLGSTAKYTVLEAELTGILIAVHMLKKTDMQDDNTASIYTDSQLAIKRIARKSRKGNQPVLRAIQETVRTMRGRIAIRWIPGHKGVAGNERADEVVKETEEGRRHPTDKTELPEFLTGSQPINAEAERKAYAKELMKMWNKRWRKAKKRREGGTMEENVLLDEFQKVAKELTRPQISLLIQARSDHLPLNARLYMIRKAETSKCPRCRTRRGGTRADEDVQHVVYECTAYTRSRRELWRKVGGENKSIREMTAEAEKAKALIVFLIGTGRLSRKWEAAMGEEGEAREEEEERGLHTIVEEDELN